MKSTCGARPGGNRVTAARDSLLMRGLLDIAQTCGFAAKPAKIKQARTAHLGRTHQVDFVDHSRMDRENALYSLAEADLAHGETGLRAVVALDHYALEGLHALFVTFLDLHVNPNRVTGTEGGKVVALCFRQ